MVGNAGRLVLSSYPFLLHPYRSITDGSEAGTKIINRSHEFRNKKAETKASRKGTKIRITDNPKANVHKNISPFTTKP